MRLGEGGGGHGSKNRRLHLMRDTIPDTGVKYRMTGGNVGRDSNAHHHVVCLYVLTYDEYIVRSLSEARGSRFRASRNSQAI